MPERPAANDLAYRHELRGIDEILQRSGLDEFILDAALGKSREDSGRASRRGISPRTGI